MKNGPELATRFYKELTDIQVGHHTLLLLIQGSAVLYGLLHFCLALVFFFLFLYSQYGRTKRDWAPVIVA